MSLPRSWAEAYQRLAFVLADEPSAREWVREALEKTWGVLDPADLERARRGLALQRVSGVVIALEEEGGDLAFFAGIRQLVVATFGRYFRVALDGPPWRVSPYEDLPTCAEWFASADF